MKLIRRLDASRFFYTFSKDNPPQLHVTPGETVCIETVDSYGNQLTEAYTGEPRKLEGINPVTGPVYIEGAAPGDTLVVEILQIETADMGTMYIRQGAGLFGALLNHAEITKIPIREGVVHLSDCVRLPLQPMIGVIGTAPPGQPVMTGSPSRHGGNMDTRHITKGATLYLGQDLI